MMKVNAVNNFESNLLALNERVQGQKFYVSEGELKVVQTRLEKIWYFFFRRVIQAEVRSVITQVVSQLEPNHKGLTDLFFKKLNRLSENVYDRSKINPDVIQRIKPVNSAEGLAYAVEEVRFAQTLGVEFKLIDEGASGSYFGRDYTGKTLVVFKPADETSGSNNTPKIRKKIAAWFQREVPLLRSHSFIEKRKMHESEALAYRVDQSLGFGIVPETDVVTLKSKRFNGAEEKEGSCQLFVSGAKSAEEEYGLINTRFAFFKWLQLKLRRKKVEPVDHDDLRKLAVLDFIFGNQDRHFKNWLIKDRKIVLIDNGCSFGKHYPLNFLSLRHMYIWRWLPEAEEITLEGVDLSNLPKFNDVYTNERVQVLKAAIAENKSIAYLGSIRTQKEFARAKKELYILE